MSGLSDDLLQALREVAGEAGLITDAERMQSYLRDRKSVV